MFLGVRVHDLGARPEVHLVLAFEIGAIFGVEPISDDHQRRLVHDQRETILQKGHQEVVAAVGGQLARSNRSKKTV